MLPTPSTSHVDYDTIYEPAEDSFFFLDTLSSASETQWLHTWFSNTAAPSPLIAEIGTGSGVVIAFAAAHSKKIFGRNDIVALGLDVNEYACKAAKQTAMGAAKDFSPNGKCAVYLGSVCADLNAALLSHSIDVLIFNPPYVPTEKMPTLPDVMKAETLDYKAASNLISLTYSGGTDGMETTIRVLNALPDILSDRGIAYILLCASNRPEQVKASIRDWGKGWQAETVGLSGKKAGWEKLEIVRIWRQKGP